MEDKILDCVNYIRNISKEKVISERKFVCMKRNDESLSEGEIQETIADLIKLSWRMGESVILYSLSSWQYFGCANADYRRAWTKLLRNGNSNHWSDKYHNWGYTERWKSGWSVEGYKKF